MGGLGKKRVDQEEEEVYVTIDRSSNLLNQIIAKEVDRTMRRHSKQLQQQAASSGVLDLSHQRLRTIPTWVFDLVHLKRLHLNNNQLEVIDRRISRFRELQVLDLSSNLLTQLPDEMGFLPTTCVVNASNNKLSKVPSALFSFYENGKSRLHTESNLSSLENFNSWRASDKYTYLHGSYVEDEERKIAAREEERKQMEKDRKLKRDTKSEMMRSRHEATTQRQRENEKFRKMKFSSSSSLVMVN